MALQIHPLLNSPKEDTISPQFTTQRSKEGEEPILDLKMQLSGTITLDVKKPTNKQNQNLTQTLVSETNENAQLNARLSVSPKKSRYLTRLDSMQSSLSGSNMAASQSNNIKASDSIFLKTRTIIETENKTKLKSIMTMFFLHFIRTKIYIVQNIFMRSILYRKARLNMTHYAFFNDLTMGTELFQGQSRQEGQKTKLCKHVSAWLSKIVRFSFKQIQTIPLLHPQQKLYWDCFVVFTILLGLWLVMFHIACQTFNFAVYYSAWALPVLFLDIVAFLNTSYYEEGKQETRRPKIALKYMHERMGQDLVSLSSLLFHALFSQNSDFIYKGRFVLLLFFAKYFTINKMKLKLQEKFIMNQNFSHMYDLIKLLMTVLTFIHIVACTWVAVAQYEIIYDDKTWLDSVSYVDEDQFQMQYLLAFYYATITMTTVGYGDITPKNYIETIVSIFFTIISSIVFAFTLNSIGDIIDGLRGQEKIEEDLMIKLNKYLKDKNISDNLSYGIREHVEYYFKQSLQTQKETEAAIFEILSDTLKQKLLMESYKVALQDSPIFKRNFSEDALEKTVGLVQEVHYNPEQIVFLEHEEGDSILFVNKGELEIFIAEENFEERKGVKRIKVLYTLKKGQVLGEIEFFCSERRQYSVRSKDFSTCLKIDREAFLRNIKENPQDYEKFCSIRDKMRLYNDFSDIDMRCYACRSHLHSFKKCPYLTLFPNNYKIVKQHLKSPEAERTNFKRGVSKEQTFKNIADTVEQCVLFFEDNVEWLLDIGRNWRLKHYGLDVLDHFGEQEEDLMLQSFSTQMNENSPEASPILERSPKATKKQRQKILEQNARILGQQGQLATTNQQDPSLAAILKELELLHIVSESDNDDQSNSSQNSSQRRKNRQNRHLKRRVSNNTPQQSVQNQLPNNFTDTPTKKQQQRISQKSEKNIQISSESNSNSSSSRSSSSSSNSGGSSSSSSNSNRKDSLLSIDMGHSMNIPQQDSSDQNQKKGISKFLQPQNVGEQDNNNNNDDTLAVSKTIKKESIGSKKDLLAPSSPSKVTSSSKPRLSTVNMMKAFEQLNRTTNHQKQQQALSLKSQSPISKSQPPTIKLMLPIQKANTGSEAAVSSSTKQRQSIDSRQLLANGFSKLIAEQSSFNLITRNNNNSNNQFFNQPNYRKRKGQFIQLGNLFTRPKKFPQNIQEQYNVVDTAGTKQIPVTKAAAVQFQQPSSSQYYKQQQLYDPGSVSVDSFFNDYDHQKTFVIYFPKNNLKNVLKKYNKSIIKTLEVLRQQRAEKQIQKIQGSKKNSQLIQAGLSLAMKNSLTGTLRIIVNDNKDKVSPLPSITIGNQKKSFDFNTQGARSMDNSTN